MTAQARKVKAEVKPGVTMLDLEPHHCRYILGKTKGPATLFCGELKEAGYSWCHAHRLAVFPLSTPRRRR